MKDKNKSKVLKTTPLTFEEKMEKMIQDQAVQIASLTNIVQMQFEMISVIYFPFLQTVNIFGHL